MKTKVSFLFAALLFLNLADLFLTAKCLSVGVQELNPIMAYLFQHNFLAAILLKLVVVPALAFFLSLGAHAGFKLAEYGLTLITYSYSIVVLATALSMHQLRIL